MIKKSYTCIVCPKSCDITLCENDDGKITVNGNSCNRGEEYAKSEFSHPKRMITTTVKIEGADLRRLPVVSSEAVPKEKLHDCLECLYNLKVEAPVKLHDIIVKNILGTNIDIFAARDMDRRK